MTRILRWLGAGVCLGLGCAATSMDLGADHPGSPGATAAPVVEPSPVLAEEPAAPEPAAEEQPGEGAPEDHHGHGGH